jgi:hypothetical protein
MNGHNKAKSCICFAKGPKNLHIFLWLQIERKNFRLLKTTVFYVNSSDLFQAHSFATRSPQFRSGILTV